MKHFLLSSSNAVLKKPNHILNTFGSGSEKPYNTTICNTVKPSAASIQNHSEQLAVQNNSSHRPSKSDSPATKSAVKRKLEPQPEDSVRYTKFRIKVSPTRSRTPSENKISKYLTKDRKQAGNEQGDKQPTMTCENTSLVGKDGVSHDAHPVPSLVKGVNNYITKNGKLLKTGVEERKERMEVRIEVGKEGGHREEPMENDSGKISLVGEKGVH